MSFIILSKTPDIEIPRDTKEIFVKKHKKTPNGSTLPKTHITSVENTDLHTHRA